MPDKKNEKTYVCLGSCQAVISEEEYNKGLTACGTEGCTMEHKPFVRGKKDEKTGKNVAEKPQQSADSLFR